MNTNVKNVKNYMATATFHRLPLFYYQTKEISFMMLG